MVASFQAAAVEDRAATLHLDPTPETADETDCPAPERRPRGACRRMSARASGALHTVTPYLVYRDAAGALAFCRAAFGATEVLRHVEPGADGGERIAHAQLRLGDSLLMVSQANSAYPEMPAVEDRAPSPVSLFLEVDDADATVARALAQGARLAYPVADRDYGRSGTVQDPFGVLWHVTSPPRAA